MKFKRFKFDYSLLFTVIILVIFGVLMVYSTSFYTLAVKNKSVTALLISGFFHVGIGVVAMIFAIFFDYRYYRKLTPIIAIAAIGLSFAVIKWGVEFGGARRWLVLPIVKIVFMPSEFSKIALIFISAYLIEGAGKRVKGINHFLFMVFVIVIFVGLTVAQRDFSTSAMMGMLVLTMMFVGGGNFLYSLLLFIVAVFGGYIYIETHPYAMNRIMIYLSTVTDRTYVFNDDNYQIINSLYAVGTGGMGGKGFGQGEFKLLHLPEVTTDFIFAIICEELGYIVTLGVLVLFCFLIFRIFKIALASQDKFAFCIASGAGILIALQVLINVGVVLNLLPTTGVTLPFLSKGGTSVIMLMYLMGVVLNISAHTQSSEVD